MLFGIDETKYRVIDLGMRLDPPGSEYRPFKAERDVLNDGLFMHRISTHTHVGTHIESPAHFRQGGRGLEDYPLDKFYGRAVRFEFSGINYEPIEGSAFEANIGSVMRENDIIVCWNSHPEWERVRNEDIKRLPYLSHDGAQWVADHKAKMLVIHEFTGIRPSFDSYETSRRNHEILMGGGVEVLLMEYAAQIKEITKKEFFFMALPVRFGGVDSMWARPLAIEER